MQSYSKGVSIKKQVKVRSFYGTVNSIYAYL